VSSCQNAVNGLGNAQTQLARGIKDIMTAGTSGSFATFAYYMGEARGHFRSARQMTDSVASDIEACRNGSGAGVSEL